MHIKMRWLYRKACCLPRTAAISIAYRSRVAIGCLLILSFSTDCSCDEKKAERTALDYSEYMTSKAEGITPLMKAAKKGDLNEAKRLIKAGADVNEKDVWGTSALVVAVKHGRKDVVRELLKADADTEVRVGTGWTSLMLAVEQSNVEIVKLLLRYGADINAKNDRGETSILNAVQEEKDIPVLRVLIKHGADVNEQENHGTTPLIAACFRAGEGKKDIVQILLENGALPEVEDKWGNTAMKAAEKAGDKDVIEMLKKALGREGRTGPEP